MGFFANLKRGAFLTKCKVACLKYGFDQAGAELFVDSGAQLLLDCHGNNLKPEAALGILSGMILKNKSNVPMQMLGAAHRYATSFASQYPNEEIATQLKEAIIKAKSA